MIEREKINRVYHQAQGIERGKPRGQKLFEQREVPVDRAFYVTHGLVAEYTTSPQGDKRIHFIAHPGDQLGIRDIEDSAYSTTAKALTRAKVVVAQIEALQEQEEWPAARMGGLQERLERVEKLNDTLRKPPLAKVADVLAEVASVTNPIPRELSQHVIAEVTGDSRQTVNIAMQRLKREGVVVPMQKSLPRDLLVINLEKLKEFGNK